MEMHFICIDHRTDDHNHQNDDSSVLWYCENRVDKRNWTRVNDRSAFWDNMKI